MSKYTDKLAPLDTYQADYLRKSVSSWLNVAEGGVRAGKNVINVIGFCMALEQSDKEFHLIAGKTKGRAQNCIIVSDGLGVENYFGKDNCVKCKHKDNDAYKVNTRNGIKTILVAGGGNKGSEESIQGDTYGCIYITEVNLVTKEFLNMALSRTMSVENPKIFLDLNPKSPMHWFYTDFLDMHEVNQSTDEAYGFNYIHLTIENNLSISDEVLDREKKKFKVGSLFYKIFILGIRAVASGRIYTSFEPSEVLVTAEWLKKNNIVRFSIGVDVGGKDATVMTLLGFTADFKECVVLDGYYHKQGNADFMNESKYISQILDLLDEWNKAYNVTGTYVFYDTAAKLFGNALKEGVKKRGLPYKFATRAYENKNKDNKISGAKGKILDRIRLNVMLFTANRFKVVKRKRLAKWIEAYENASWDEKKSASGEHIRLDDGSYPIDCLDSLEYAMFPYKGYIIKNMEG